MQQLNITLKFPIVNCSEPHLKLDFGNNKYLIICISN